MPGTRQQVDDRSSADALEEPYPETGRRADERHPNDPYGFAYGAPPETGPARERGGMRTVERVASAVAGIAAGVTEGLSRYRNERDRFAPRSERAAPAPPPGYHMNTAPRHTRNGTRLRARIRGGTTRIERFRLALRRTADRVQHKAEDVQEAAQRSRGAGAEAMDHVGDAMRAEVRAKGMSFGGYAVAGVLGIITLVLLSAGSVVAFNIAFGTPAGWFITAGIYAAVALGAIFASQMGAERQDHKAHEEMDAARHSVRRVVAPLRRGGNGHAAVRPGERERTYEPVVTAGVR